jgi:hypothetical protein
MEPLSSRQRGIERPVSKRLKLCALRVGGCRLVRDRRSDRIYWGRTASGCGPPRGAACARVLPGTDRRDLWADVRTRTPPFPASSRPRRRRQGRPGHQARTRAARKPGLGSRPSAGEHSAGTSRSHSFCLLGRAPTPLRSTATSDRVPSADSGRFSALTASMWIASQARGRLLLLRRRVPGRPPGTSVSVSRYSESSLANSMATSARRWRPGTRGRPHYESTGRFERRGASSPMS